MMLDKSQGLALGAELRGTGAVGLLGTATPATYNTNTGAGSVSRVDLSNQSFVSVASLVSGRTYRVQITVLTGTILLRAATSTGATILTLTAGSSTPLIVPTTALVIATTIGTATFTLASVRELAGNHLTQSTAASRPQYLIDGSGLPYLLFDGTDDWCISPTITPGIDKVQVFAGVRKIGDTTGVIVSSSPSIVTNNGAFRFLTGNPFYRFQSRNTAVVSATSVTAFTAPITNVATGIGDIGGDITQLRVDGVVQETNPTDQGTGNYLAYPVYVGRQGGTTSPFNGRIYQMIVRFGANLDAATITATEAFINSKTGAY
jgi:hypothetical protein